MNPIDDMNKPLPQPPASGAPELLEFLDEMKGLLTELGEAVAESKNVLQSFNFLGAPLLASHQVNILINFEKARTEMQTLLQKIENGGEPSQALSKEKIPDLSKRSEPKEANYIASASTSEKKAGEILFSLRASVNPSVENSSLPDKGQTGSFQTFSSQSNPLAKEPKISQPAFQASEPSPLEKRPAHQFNISAQAPMVEILQKIKPLLDHLLVVVETQENMSRPSQKWTGLVRSLIRSQASLSALDIASLLKPAPTKKNLDPSQVSQDRKAASDKQPFVKTLLSPPQPSRSASPCSEFLAAPSMPFSEPSPKTPQDPKVQQPFAAPFTAEKKIERRKKGSWKKKLKSFWSKRDPEEEEKNPS